KRNAEQEATIIKRMHSFFKKNHSHVHQQIVTGKRKGFLIAFSGIVLLLGASYISYLKFVNFMMHAAVVVLEPAGWYLIWSGIESTMDSWKKRRPDFSFYHKMAKSRIVFASI
ncbi:MAG TPA: hypothetical protein VGO45_01140, partial [Bacteroidia bacterium]|nr:hypothetical protein [Bacteroidia bacterium]